MRYCSRKSRIPSAAISCRRAIIDWGAIFALVPKAKQLIELHNSQFAMPVFDTDWLKSQHYIDLYEYAGLAGKAVGKREPEVADQGKNGDRLAAAIGIGGAASARPTQ